MAVKSVTCQHREEVSRGTSFTWYRCNDFTNLKHDENEPERQEKDTPEVCREWWSSDDD
jgi:hypothetical protein